MIEIIREEDWDSTTEKRALPKDIKQIGRPDIGDRIYVENQAYHFLHPYESQDEKTAYVLLGRFENYAGRECTFVEAVIRLEEVEFEGDLPLWTDHTWAYIYKQLKKEHDDMVIVGWAMDIKGQLPNMTVRLEALHQKNFGGLHQILLLMDTLEGEENFYGSRNGHLYRREGFYIYYEKNIPENLSETMRELELEQEKERETEERAEEPEPIILEEPVSEPERAEEQILEAEIPEESVLEEKVSAWRGNYRKQMIEKDEKQQMPSYVSSLVLLAVVCVLGFTAFQNYQKMNAMEATLAQINTGENVPATEVAAGTESMGAGVKVESVAGNVKMQGMGDTNQQTETVADFSGEAQTPPQEPAEPSQPAGDGTDGTIPDAAAQAGDTNQQEPVTENTAPETTDASTPAMTEAQSYLTQGYYIVQKGDSLVGICRKIYQTTAMMDKLCEVNKIENKDAIYAGQYLTLPN